MASWIRRYGVQGYTSHRPPYRHMLRIRAPMSSRTCRRIDAARAAVAATIGQVMRSNSGKKAAGMKRVRDA